MFSFRLFQFWKNSSEREDCSTEYCSSRRSRSISRSSKLRIVPSPAGLTMSTIESLLESDITPSFLILSERERISLRSSASFLPRESLSCENRTGGARSMNAVMAEILKRPINRKSGMYSCKSKCMPRFFLCYKGNQSSIFSRNSGGMYETATTATPETDTMSLRSFFILLMYPSAPL